MAEDENTTFPLLTVTQKVYAPPTMDPGTLSNVFAYVIGIIVNTLLLIYIIKNKVCGALSIALFRWQTFMDALVCIFGLYYRLQHFTKDENDGLPITGFFAFDSFLCYVVYSGMFFWGLFLWSVFNLCNLACERFISVCKPFLYRELKMRHIVGAILICGFVSAATCFPWCLPQGRHPEGSLALHNGVCINVKLNATANTFNFYLFFTILYWIWFLNSFFFPFVALTIFYTLIVTTLRTKKNISTTFDSAARGFTVLMLCASVVFVTTQAFPNILWLLEGALHIENLGLDDYFYQTSVVNLFVYLLTAANSMANPFIYFGYFAVKKLKESGYCGGTDDKDVTKMSENA